MSKFYKALQQSMKHNFHLDLAWTKFHAKLFYLLQNKDENKAWELFSVFLCWKEMLELKSWSL